MTMPTEYEKALTHVIYEYAALESAYNLAFNATTTPPFVAAFDSFLVHYRSLGEFFHATSGYSKRCPDDIRAGDYVAAWRTPYLPMWDTWKPSMHILLAHLSTKRNAIHEQKTGFDHRVHFEPMRDEIRTAWAEFEKGLMGTIHGGKVTPLLKEHRENFTRPAGVEFHP
jgi:hypothetical protein